MRDVMLIIHFLGIAMGVGTGFANLFLGMAAKKLEAKEAEAFLLKTLYLNYMGKGGLVLLILSGGYLMTPYWALLSNKPILIAKLVLVVLLTVFLVLASIYGKKATQNNGGEYLGKMKTMGQLILLTGILIVITAVFSFH